MLKDFRLYTTAVIAYSETQARGFAVDASRSHPLGVSVFSIVKLKCDSAFISPNGLTGVDTEIHYHLLDLGWVRQNGVILNVAREM